MLSPRVWHTSIWFWHAITIHFQKSQKKSCLTVYSSSNHKLGLIYPKNSHCSIWNSLCTTRNISHILLLNVLKVFVRRSFALLNKQKSFNQDKICDVTLSVKKMKSSWSMKKLTHYTNEYCSLINLKNFVEFISSCALFVICLLC